MPIKWNLSTILTILGGLGVFAPDVTVLATWLASMHISWMSYVVRGLGALAVFFVAAPRVVPRLRAFLALLGLATAPGVRAPGGDVPAPRTSRATDPDSEITPAEKRPHS